VEARWLWEHYLVSARRVCGLMLLGESSYRYVSRRNDEPLRLRLLEAAREKPRWGYRRLQIVVDQTGEHVNHKRIYRVYREAGLMIRRRARKRLRREGSPREALRGANQEWALDFVHDAAESGRKFRALSVVDPYTRECLALEVDTSLGSRRVTRVLEAIIAERGAPQAIRSDNGPEFTSRHFLAWCMERGIELVHIEPGKPVQNAHVESFHGKLRDECLNASWFANLFEARRKIAAWRREYNEERPHSSLGYRTPAAFAAAVRNEEGCGKDASGKTETRFPPALGNPAEAAGFPLSHSHGGGGDSSLSGEVLKPENHLGSDGSVV
jgi:putative transposase